jgi:hypothetical protein
MPILNKVFEKVDNILEIIKRPLYLGTVFLLEFIYVLIFFKIIDYTPQILLYLHYFIQGFIALFLIIKFHPFRKHEIKEFDSTIIFGSAMVLLANIGITEFIKKNFENTTKKADNIVKNVEQSIIDGVHNNTNL